MPSKVFAAVALVAFASPFAHAQEQSSSPATQQRADSPAAGAPIMQALPDAEQNPLKTVEEFVAGQVEGQLVATDAIDRPLHDRSGAEVGTVVDVLIDEDRRLSLVVVDVGDYLGADKKVAFSFDALGYRASDEEIRLVADVAREDLEKAPAFTSLAEAAELGDMQGMSADDDVPQPVDEPQPMSQ